MAGEEAEGDRGFSAPLGLLSHSDGVWSSRSSVIS